MTMEPVVNGLEETYQAQVEFQSVNASSIEGQKAFRFYGTPGHPSFVLLNSEGEVLWRGFGEQSKETIEVELVAALTNWQGAP